MHIFTIYWNLFIFHVYSNSPHLNFTSPPMTSHTLPWLPVAFRPRPSPLVPSRLFYFCNFPFNPLLLFSSFISLSNFICWSFSIICERSAVKMSPLTFWWDINPYHTGPPQWFFLLLFLSSYMYAVLRTFKNMNESRDNYKLKSLINAYALYILIQCL